MKIDPIYLTKKDVINLNSKKIAAGTEGTIYRIKPGTLYKIYHDYNDNMYVVNPPVYDAEGVNIANYKNKGKVKYQKNTLRYLDQEGIRLSREEALYKAIERQREIQKTYLPQNVIYVNKRVKGCVLHEHTFTKKIYCVQAFPLKYQLKILKDLLEKVRELIEHNIYHIDLAQRPTKEFPNTNVLLKLPLDPQIIDLDGHSSIYTEFFSDQALKKTESNFALLCMEILTGQNLEKYLSDLEEITEINPLELERIMIENIAFLAHHKIPETMIQEFLEQKLTLDKMAKHLETLSRKR